MPQPRWHLPSNLSVERFAPTWMRSLLLRVWKPSLFHSWSCPMSPSSICFKWYVRGFVLTPAATSAASAPTTWPVPLHYPVDLEPKTSSLDRVDQREVLRRQIRDLQIKLSDQSLETSPDAFSLKEQVRRHQWCRRHRRADDVCVCSIQRDYGCCRLSCGVSTMLRQSPESHIYIVIYPQSMCLYPKRRI